MFLSNNAVYGFTPAWCVAAFATALLLLAPLFVVASEDQKQKKTGRSALCAWLFFHTFEGILLTVASLFAIWRLEKGYSLLSVAFDCYLTPTCWILGTVLFGRRRNVLRARSVYRSK